jgi:hypothetical protein
MKVDGTMDSKTKVFTKIYLGSGSGVPGFWKVVFVFLIDGGGYE